MKNGKSPRRRRLFCWLLMLLMLLTGCAGPGSNGDPTGPASGTDAGEPPEPSGPEQLLLAEDGESEFRIVLPLGASDLLEEAAQRIRSRIEETTGARLAIVDDSGSATDCEILIGEVSRMERLEVFSEQSLGQDDFAVAVRGQRIVIIGGSEAATIEAADYFLATSVLIDEGSRTAGIQPDYIHTMKAEENGAMTITELTDSYAYFTVNPGSGAEVLCRLNYAGNHGWRLLTGSDDGSFEETGASQQLSLFLGEDPVQTVEPISCEETAQGAVLRAGDGSRVELTCEPFGISCYSPSGRLVISVTDVRAGATGSGISGLLEPQEAVFGTGERFNGANQRGNKIELYALDQWNTVNGNGYMPIPVFASSRGSGVFVNRYEPMTADLGAADSDVWRIDVQKVGMDCYLFASDQISDVLYGYSMLSGFAEMPDDWNFGVLVCRYSPDFSTKEGIYAMIDKMEQYDLPWTGVIIEGWSIYNTQNYDDLKEVVDYVHSLGKKVMAYLAAGVVETRNVSLPSESYLVRISSNGSTNIPIVSSGTPNPDVSSGSDTRVFLDLTNPEACEWFFGEVWGRLVYDIGIDGAKIDFCELFPESIELDLYDGDISGAHHWYPTYFNSLFYEMLSEKADGGMNFSRGGGIGSQRNPFMWAGDQTREFSRLQTQLSAVLSSGLSGVPFMTYDMAGYRPSTQSGQKDDEARVFIRGTQMTAFTACIQTHGNVTRPYDFDEQTIDIYRAYTKLHELLVPYIREYAEIACQTGMPLVRHLVLAYQNDVNVYDIEDEFLFGDGLLVAPVLDDSTSRDVYLPEGRWQNLFTGEVYEVGAEGMTLTGVQVPIQQIPVYVNLDHSSETLDDLLAQAQEILDSLR